MLFGRDPCKLLYECFIFRLNKIFVFYLSIPTFLETRFKFVTFKLDKQGLARDTWQRMIDLSGERFFMIDPISARTASDMLHKLTYEPISCTSVRVGANELDEIRAVTIHFDSICICGGFSVCPCWRKVSGVHNACTAYGEYVIHFNYIVLTKFLSVSTSSVKQ